MKQRIKYLDGLRGVAILLVILFHAYARWTALVPYGELYSEIFIFKFGWLGVQSFFMISGYVILMTLENSKDRKDFLYRRWIRLFPAMLASSFIIFITSYFFVERPNGQPNWQSLLPGLTFIEPGWWALALGHPIVSLEGAFWSLFVEFKFYIFCSIIYFWSGRNALMWALIGAFLLFVLTKIADNYFGFGVTKIFVKICENLSFQYFGWFFSGAAFYIYMQKKTAAMLGIALSASFAASVVTANSDWSQFIAACIVALIFPVSQNFSVIQSLLGNKFIQFFGVVSYPLYLIHENMMVSIIIKLGSFNEFMGSILLPLPAIAVISFAAYLINKYVEPCVKFVLIKIAGQFYNS